MTPSARNAQLLGVASRAVARAGLAQAYGHCSLRLDAQSFLVSPAKPLGLMDSSDSGIRVSIDGPLPADVLGEVRIHQQVYKARADVAGIVRFQSPKVVSLSTLGRTPLVRHGLGSYFAPQPPFWRDPRLIRDDDRATAVAATLGHARAIVLRGNGAVTVGATLQEACVLAWYLEDAARVELDVLASGQDGLIFDADECASRATARGRIFERMWDWLIAGDPQAPQFAYDA